MREGSVADRRDLQLRRVSGIGRRSKAGSPKGPTTFSFVGVHGVLRGCKKNRHCAPMAASRLRLADPLDLSRRSRRFPFARSGQGCSRRVLDSL